MIQLELIKEATHMLKDALASYSATQAALVEVLKSVSENMAREQDRRDEAEEREQAYFKDSMARLAARSSRTVGKRKTAKKPARKRASK